jgi:hypothetical protein
MTNTILTVIIAILVSILFIVFLGIFLFVPTILGILVHPAWTLFYCLTLPCATALWSLID